MGEIVTAGLQRWQAAIKEIRGDLVVYGAYLDAVNGVAVDYYAGRLTKPQVYESLDRIRKVFSGDDSRRAANG